MDALPPSLPNAGRTQPVPAGMAGLAILLAELNETLAKLPAGTQIPAQVTQILPQVPLQAPPQGQSQTLPPAADAAAAKTLVSSAPLLQLTTPQGPVQIRIPAAVQIPVGAKLEITVAAAGPQPQWRLTMIDGKPVSFAVPSTPSPVSSPASTVSAVANVTPRPTLALGIPATLVKSADPLMPSGTTLLVRITNLVPAPPPQIPTPALVPQKEPEVLPLPETEPEDSVSLPKALTAQIPTATAAAIQADVPSAAPAPTVAPSPIAGPMPVPAAAPTPTSAAAPTATAVPTAAVPAGTIIPAPIPSSAPVPISASGPTPLSAPALTPPPAEISGQVLPSTDAGRPLIKTPVGLLALTVDPQSAPPAGAHVTLTVLGKPIPPVAPPLPPPPDERPDKALPRRLSELVEQVQTRGPEKLAEALRQAIPAPGPKLAAQLLSVIAAAEPSRGLPRWLGESLASALTHSAPEAMAQLSRQWEAISQPVHGPDDGAWRTLLLPLMMGGQMTLVRLTTRQNRRGSSPAEREKGTRFLLDLELSRLGPMQFDGLVERQHKRFDLIIRSKVPLPGEMRRDIDALFLNGLMNFGLEGSIGFQPEGPFIATPPLTGKTNGIIFA